MSKSKIVRVQSDADRAKKIPGVSADEEYLGWWCVGLDEPMGPYATRKDCETDRIGVERFRRSNKSLYK